MWLPGTAVGYALAAASAVFWGTFSNTQLAASKRGVRWPFWILDFTAGIVAAMTVAAFVLGSVGSAETEGETGVLGNLAGADPLKAVFAAAAGILWGAANTLLFAGIALGGLAVVFPIVVGVSVAGGTVLTYAVEPEGSPALLFTGAALSMTAVTFVAAAHRVRERAANDKARLERASSRELVVLAAPVPAPPTDDGLVSPPASLSPALEADVEDDEEARAERAARRKLRLTFLIGIGSGVLLMAWSPLMALAQSGRGELSPYAALWLFTLGGAAGHLATNAVLLRHPLDGSAPATEGAYRGHAARDHLWGVLGGAMWTGGMMSNVVAASQIGFAVSFTLGSVAPVVGASWGLFYFREFDGAPPRAFHFLAVVFALYAGAVACVVMA